MVQPASTDVLVLCRTQEGVKRSMQLKDAMRESCLADLAQAWFNLLQAYQSANPDLAAAVLNTVERYVNWIDVSLVVNERQAQHQSLNSLPVHADCCSCRVV